MNAETGVSSPDEGGTLVPGIVSAKTGISAAGVHFWNESWEIVKVMDKAVRPQTVPALRRVARRGQVFNREHGLRGRAASWRVGDTGKRTAIGHD